jgi:CheY-specific phosphatase CheX
MDLKQRTVEVITRILEEAAFVFTDTLSADDVPDPEIWDASGVVLKFCGQASGEMRMWASTGFSSCVAANMLGVGEDDPAAAEKGFDALKESLNIIVGNYLTEIYGEKPVFDLGLPEQVEREKLAGDFANPDAVLLAADDHPVLFVVEIVKTAVQ